MPLALVDDFGDGNDVDAAIAVDYCCWNGVLTWALPRVLGTAVLHSFGVTILCPPVLLIIIVPGLFKHPCCPLRDHC